MYLRKNESPEVVGNTNWGELVGPLVNLGTSVIDKFGGSGKKPPPPPPKPEIPWVPISIGGGTLAVLLVILSMKR